MKRNSIQVQTPDWMRDLIEQRKARCAAMPKAETKTNIGLDDTGATTGTGDTGAGTDLSAGSGTNEGAGRSSSPVRAVVGRALPRPDGLL